MQSGKGHKLIGIIVGKGMGSKIVAEAKAAGAQGGTIIHGRGTAAKSIYESILGIPYQPEKELVLIGVDASLLDDVLAVIVETGNLNKPGKGVCFVVNLTKLHGVAHLGSMV